MAKTFGVIREDRRSGRATDVFIDIRLDGKRYKIRSIPAPSGGKLRIRDRETAEEVLQDIRADIRTGKPALQAITPYLTRGAPELTFGFHWRRFVEAKERQGRQGRDGQARQLSSGRLGELQGHERRGHLAALLAVPIHELGYGVLEDWRDSLLDGGLSPKSVRHLVADVGTCLRWLVKRGDLARMPQLPTVHVPDYAPKIPTPEMQDKILAAIPWELRGAFLARGYMGLRPSEARRANVEDYNFETGVLTVHGKGGRVRYLPADPEVARWVQENVNPRDRLRDANRGPVPIFANPRATGDDKRWTKASDRRVFLKACEAVGVEFKPNEALRHAFGTQAVNRGVSLDRTGAYMGHTETKTTQRYAKLDTTGLSDVLRPR